MDCSKSCGKIFCYVILFLGYFKPGYISGQTTKKCKDVDLQTGVGFFDRTTRQFIHWLQKDPPSDELVKELVKNWNNKTAGVKTKVALYERSFLVVSGVLLLSALVTSVTGFGIIWYGKFRKTRRDDQFGDADVDKPETNGYMVVLAFVSCFLIVIAVCLFVSNNQLSDDLPRARSTLIRSIENLQDFQNNTIQGLDQILRSDFDRTLDDSLNQFRAVADCKDGGLDTILKNRKVIFNKASESAISALYRIREALSRLNLTSHKLRGLSSGLRSELGKMNRYFEEAKRLCSSSAHVIAGDVCKMFISEKDNYSRHLPPELETSNNVTVITSRLDNFLKHLNFSSVYKVLKFQEGIERRLCKERSKKLKELEKLCNGIRFARSFTLDTIKKYSNQLAVHTLIPMKNKVGNVLKSDGSIGRYDHKRWWISFVIFLTVLLASMTTLLGLLLKQVEPFISHIPSNIHSPYMVKLKTWFPWLPKRVLLSSTIVHLSLAVLVNLCAGMVFLVLSNMALVCEVSADYDKLDNIFSTSDLLQKSKLFFKEKKLKLFKEISQCPQDGTLWVMFNFDEKFDINNSINKLNGIPRIASRLFQDSSVFDERKEIHLQEFNRILQEWRSIGLGNVNINFLAEQTNNPTLDKSFQKLSKALLTSYQHGEGNRLENVTRTPFKIIQSRLNKANVIEENYIKMYSVLSKFLTQGLNDFNNSRKEVIASFANISDIYSDIVANSITDGKHEVVDHQVRKTVEVIKDFMNDSISKVRNEVGKCDPLKQSYNQTVCLFCRDLFGSWNTWWILLLVCGFLTILSIVLCFLTLKQFS